MFSSSRGPLPGDQVERLLAEAAAEIAEDGPSARVAAGVVLFLSCVDTRAAADEDALDAAVRLLGKRTAVSVLGAMQRRAEIVADLIELTERS